MRKKSLRILLIVGIPGLTGFIVWMAAAGEQSYLPTALFLVVLSMLPFFIRFERRPLQPREIVLVAVLSAVGAAGRLPFAALPGVQPTSFVIIVTAIAFGGETGFLVGAVSALVSNMFLGQGPWTPWQMFAWGMMGFSAGLLNHRSWMRYRLVHVIFGLIWGFIFGWIMNGWYLLNMGQVLTWPSVLATYAASFYFDLAHAMSNVFFLALFGSRWLKILERYKRKYGLLGG